MISGRQRISISRNRASIVLVAHCYRNERNSNILFALKRNSWLNDVLRRQLICASGDATGGYS